MAARYWVTGGTGNTNSTTNWSTTSGGASGASVPGTTDDAIWDANSGTGIVNVNATLSVLSADFTNFTGTLSGSQSIQLNGGDVTYGTGMTITNTGNLIFAASSTLTSNGKEISGAITINTGFPNGGTITLNGDFKCGTFVHTVIAGIVNINGSDLYIKGHTITFAVSSSRTISGTSHIYFTTETTTLSIFVTGNITNNLTFRPTNNITQIGSVICSNSTVVWDGSNGGAWIPGVTAFQFNGTITLDLAGMNINQWTMTSTSTVTINSLLTVKSIVHGSSGVITLAGPYGFIAQNYSTTSTTTGRSIILAPNIEYIFTNSFHITTGWVGSMNSFSSSSAGNKAKLTLLQGVTQIVPYCNFTDIDAGNGETIWVYEGSISGSTNVYQLPHSPSVITNVF